MLGMPESDVRAAVRSGLLRPARQGRRYAFSFQDLVVLRAARELADRKVPKARVRRALATLANELPEGRSLSGLRIQAAGSEVAVRADGTTWNPESGQTLFAFDVDELAQAVEKARAPLEPRPDTQEDVAERSFEQGLELEDHDAPGAERAYRRALEIAPGLVDARVNLGRLVHERGDAAEAAALYRRALSECPEDPVIHFNLGLALEDAGEPAHAAGHYERAIALDDAFADAHFNLARLCEDLGRGTAALRHYHAYKKLTES